MNFDGSALFNWNHDHLLSVLTSGHNAVVKNTRLIQALKIIKREDFVKDEHKNDAYKDSDLHIGFGENISKPTTSAQMIEILNPKVGAKVLDIGTGSGWSAALISHMVGEKGKVYTIEREQYLLEFARNNISKYPQLNNIEFIFRDGMMGLPEKGPFDSIHISANMESLPKIFLEQINIGGRILYPNKEYKLVTLDRLSKDNWKETYHKGFILDEIKQGIN